MSSSKASRTGLKAVVAATLKKASTRSSDSLRSTRHETVQNVASPLPKRGPGRPPKAQVTPAPNPPVAAVPVTSAPPVRAVVEESRKKIANCSSPLGRPRQPPPKRGGRPLLVRPPREESESEDDIPPAFSDVVKIITKKVQETQIEINSIEESYNNYKKAHEQDTNFAMKFYAAVPQLYERVEAGAAFDDELIESVFRELFPANGEMKKHKHAPAVETAAKLKKSTSRKRPADESTSDSEPEPTRPRRSSLKH